MHDHEHLPDEVTGPGPRPAEAAGTEQRLQRALLDGRSDALDPATVLRLQRAVGNGGVGAFLQRDEDEGSSPVHDVVGRGGGQPLDKDTRSYMEDRLGADFSDVRVHTDGQAAASAKSVAASAYTVGQDVVFGDGQYSPSTDTGRKTLAHELTHVVQQRQGPVDGTPGPGGVSVSDPSDRFEQEAERTAEAALQRQEEGEGEEEKPEEEEEAPPVQTMVQREGEGEGDEEVPEEEQTS